MPNEKNQSKFESYSIDFGGTEAITCPLDLQGKVKISWNLWFNSNSSLVGVASGFDAMSQGSGNDLWSVYTWSDNKLYLYMKEGGTGANTIVENFTSLVTPGTWHMLTIVYDGSLSNSDRIKCFLDNSSLTVSSPQTIPTDYPNVGLVDFNIGRSHATPSAGFDGKISQFAVFDYALSESQISSLYNSGSPINPMTLKPAPIANYLLGGNASTGGDSSKTLSVPNVAVPDASVFDIPSKSVGTAKKYIATNINNLSDIDVTDKITVSTWVNFDDVTVNAYNPVVQKGTISNGTNMSFAISRMRRANASSEGQVYASIKNASGTAATAYSDANAVSSNEWANVVMRYDGSHVKIYVNGKLHQSVAQTGNILDSTPAEPFSIGSDYYVNAGFGENLVGKISNVQIWNTDLTDGGVSDGSIATGQIAQLYNNGQPLMTGTQPQASNLKAWYKLDQSANWEADTAGNWQIPDAVSSYPQSFDFNGASSAINLGNADYLKLRSGDFTFSTWINPNSWGSGYKGIYVNSAGNGIWIGKGNGNEFVLRIYGVSNIIAYSTLPAINTWTHICITRDNGLCSLFYNGSSVATATSTHDFSGSADVFIGTDNQSAYFDGKISNLQIWDSALPATGTDSVETLYNNGVPLTTAIATDNLKAWYKLNNNDRFQGNWRNINSAENLNYTKALSRIGSDNGITSAGSGDRVNCGNNSSLQITGAMSISLWFRVNTISPPHSYNFVMGRSRFRTEAAADACWDLLLKGVSYGAPAHFRFQLSDGTTKTHYDITETTNGDFFNDRWQNLIITYDGTTNANSIKAYLNSELHQQFTSSQASINNIAARNLTFYDNDVYQYGDPTYTGALSNCAIWNKKLESSDISSIWNNGSPALTMPSESELQGWWKFSDGAYDAGNTSWSFPDSSQNSNTGLTNTFAATAVPFDADSMSDNNVQAATGISSGMTEQNLVFNNVSSLNGESSGMDTSNLVTSTLTRQVPYNSYSLNFDAGNSNYINCTDSNIFSFGDGTNDSPFSMSAWIKTSSSASKSIMSKWGTTGTSGHEWIFWTVGSPAKLRMNLNDGTNLVYRYRQGNTNVDTGEWVHAVVTYDGRGGNDANDGIKIYVNGQEESSYTNGSAGTYEAMHNTPRIVQIGAYNSVGNFDGQISNAAIFDKELTSTEVMKLYNSSVPSDLSSFHPSPIAWWSLGSDSYYNGANYICPDLIGTNNGTSSGMDANALVGNAPNSTANGTSTNMTIGANLTGSAPNSSNNSFSVNMSFDDRETDVPS